VIRVLSLSQLLRHLQKNEILEYPAPEEWDSISGKFQKKKVQTWWHTHASTLLFTLLLCDLLPFKIYMVQAVGPGTYYADAA
jgi:hypothetical protein